MEKKQEERGRDRVCEREPEPESLRTEGFEAIKEKCLVFFFFFSPFKKTFKEQEAEERSRVKKEKRQKGRKR